MVILSDSTQMSSSRSYMRKVQNNRTVYSWASGDSSRQMSSSSFESVLESKEFYQGSSSYLSYNKFGEDTQYVSGNSIQSGITQSNSGEMSAPFDKSAVFQLFARLVAMIRENRFRTLGINTLSFTSAAAPTVWNRLEQTSYFMSEEETTCFCATGSAVTADGRTLSFDVTMEMSRSFTESGQYENFSRYPQILTDPLVINLDSSPTTLSDQHFFFDLNCDGKDEELSKLASGNGFLAFDRNNDGVINNGSELFGPQSGNGFAELSRYDDDMNGWIDEADDIYDKLRVWTKDNQGNDVLLSLKESNVGAICTGSSRTDFSLTSDDNQLNAKVRSTGLYLKEGGGSGTIQQIDFA